MDFPTDLPCVSRIDGYRKGAATACVRTPFEAGNTRQRRVNRALPTEIQLAWRCDNAQFQPLIAWLNTYGYEWFNIDLSGLESSLAATFKETLIVRLMSDISAGLMRVHRQNWWLVTATAAYMPSDAVLAVPASLDPVLPPTWYVGGTAAAPSTDELVSVPTGVLIIVAGTAVDPADDDLL